MAPSVWISRVLTGILYFVFLVCLLSYTSKKYNQFGSLAARNEESEGNNEEADLWRPPPMVTLDQQRQRPQQHQKGLFSSLMNHNVATVITTSNDQDQPSLSSSSRRPEEGVQVLRSITKFMPDASFVAQVVQKLDNQDEDPCTSHDAYGDNDCHLHWSSMVTVNYTVQVNSTIVAGDTLEGHFKLDRIVPWKFTCPLCGEDCELQFPILPLNYTIEMPPCPVPPHTVTHLMEYQLWEHSPTEGLVTTHLEGTVHLIRGSTQESLAEFSVSVTVR